MKRIALADPSCPLGQYTRAYLEPLGLWNAIRERTVFLDNPHVVLAAVASEQADVGLVYLSDASTTRIAGYFSPAVSRGRQFATPPRFTPRRTSGLRARFARVPHLDARLSLAPTFRVPCARRETLVVRIMTVKIRYSQVDITRQC